MNDNPYQTTATAAGAQFDESSVPYSVYRNIKNAWICCLVSAAITLAVTLFSVYGSSNRLGFNLWNLLDVALLLGFAFGIYKKSRTCAVLLLVYFLGSKIMMIVEHGLGGAGGILGMVFLIMFWKGVSGTFEYHQYRSFAN
jgi:hypothetical protein